MGGKTIGNFTRHVSILHEYLIHYISCDFQVTHLIAGQVGSTKYKVVSHAYIFHE